MKLLLPSIITCCAATAVGSTVTQNAVTSTAGIPYRWSVQMGALDNAAFSRHVGSWSWEDNTLFNTGLGEPPVGWTHESDWAALTLAVAATLTLRIERDPTVPQPIAGDPNHLASVASMFPSFTLWSGLDQDTTQLHKYINRGEIGWAEDTTYLDHADNSTQTFVEKSWVLPAGNYTVAIGSNSSAAVLDTDRQGYRTILTTTAVPEPGALSLIALGGLTLVRRRRRPAKI